MSTLALENRLESLGLSLDSFESQEELCLYLIEHGYNHAWAIADKTSLLIGSVRRALTNLEQGGLIEEVKHICPHCKGNKCKKCKDKGYVTGVLWKATNRTVTTYKLKPQLEIFK